MRRNMKLMQYLSLGLVALMLTMAFAGCGGTSTGSHPLTVQVLDGGGMLKIFKSILQNYQKAHPDQVTFQYLPSATGPQVPPKLQAQEAAGRQDISLVLGGYDVVSSGIKEGLLQQLLPNFSSSFPNLDSNYQTQAKEYTDLAQGYALSSAYTPSGPLFEYDPNKVPNPPTTIQELQAWIHANPGKFEYAQPRNSGPGRTMLMGLPYLLGDSNPMDPVNGWSKTWAFLKDIGTSINNYPARTGTTMTDLGNDSVWMIASTMGWDINPRALNQVPTGDKVFLLQNTTFVADDLFMMMPKGLDQAHQTLIKNIMAFALQPDQQAYEYDTGYFYPGPSVKNVPVTMAPQSSQQVVQTYGRSEYTAMATTVPIVMPLSADNLNAAFDTWDQQVGGTKVK